MGKTAKVVLIGKKGVGKTAVLEQAIYGKLTKSTFLQSTIEDIYVASVETDRGVKEKLRFYDTGSDYSLNVNLLHCDGFILVFDPSKMDTLDFIIAAKKDIERNKERKEAVIVVIANHSSQSDPMIVSKAQGWTVREKLKYYDACAMDRASLYDAFVYLASRLYQQVAKSSFSQLGMRKKD
ncbi:Miro-like protein [Nesidiocoris tenuis]|uniref:Miro-like protein n=1 Tax=Nesidiocoris tenuis TaxID=355587 RepID=A0ABN7AF24_9HEMI|nr:Miro-like protein [Nesidiocoris tenuis]